jgi:hypothetical protein
MHHASGRGVRRERYKRLKVEKVMHVHMGGSYPCLELLGDHVLVARLLIHWYSQIDIEFRLLSYAFVRGCLA